VRLGGGDFGGRGGFGSTGRRSGGDPDAPTRPSPDANVVRDLWCLLAPYRWQVLGLSALISFSAALGTLAPQFVRYGFDTVIPAGTRRAFVLLGAAIAIYYLVRSLVGYAGMYYSFAFTQGIIRDIRMRAYRRLLAMPIARFTEERSGALTSRVVSDVNALEGMIQAGATRLAGQLVSIVVVAAILVAMNWRLAAVNLVVAPALALITRHYQFPLREAARRIRRRVGEMSAVATEAIANIQVVKGFANEPLEVARFDDENETYVALNLERRREVGMMEAQITLTAEYGLGAVLLIGGWLAVGGSLTIGELTAFLLYQRMLQGPVMSVVLFNNQLQAGMAALERVSALLEAEPESEGTIASVGGGRVEFRDVEFRYPGTEIPALDGVSFAVPEGATAALVGPSGSGKTTVTRLLSRLYDPTGGSIRIDGRDLREYRLDALRNAVAIVPQEPTLFSGSVRENIRYARPDATDQEIAHAAELANAATFIAELPEGWDTLVGERGVKLSGGQKQRVAIARAILRHARLLILDEATASLDSESEALIQEALDGLFARRSGVTTLVIAHRLSTIRGADRIYVLDAGRIVESGTHGELLDAAGLYARLHELQHASPAGMAPPAAGRFVIR